jgi:predicted RNase H-like nuclease (RuvC/YqgF family)
VEQTEQPLEENDKKLLENKLSKEKLKNIELRDKLKIATNKIAEYDTDVEKKEKQLADLSRQISSLMKETLTQSEKLRKGKNKDSIPFKKIEDLQEMKSSIAKLEIDLSEKEKVNAKLNNELEDCRRRIQKLTDE